MSRRVPHPPLEIASAVRIARFVGVGCGAAAVHWGVVVGLVSQGGWSPPVANVLGWLMAFGMSFTGHHLWTFRDHGASPWVSAVRFFLVSALGFALNEMSFVLLLHWSGKRYDRVLVAVLAGTAVFTYLLGRHWAFLRNPAR